MKIDHNLIIKRYGKDLATGTILFRSLSEIIDNDPNKIFNYIDEKPVEGLRLLRTLNAETFFRMYEALTYGDIGVLFASPRSCLSGILIQFIGTQEQQDYYFNYVATNKARTFFATTEVKYGSDANQIETTLCKQNLKCIINGQKILVGNLGVADIGIIIGRVNSGPLGLCAALITPDDFEINRNNIQRETLPMFGIRSALLGKANFQQFVINQTQLLGQTVKATERGLQVIIKTFNIMRLGITGLALGHSQAMIDYISQTRRNLKMHEVDMLSLWQTQLNSIRTLALVAARNNQENRLNTAEISLVKVQSSRLIETIAIKSLDFYGVDYMYEHPYLVKSIRDCFGYEYMDGTTNIHRKNIYQGLSNVRF